MADESEGSSLSQRESPPNVDLDEIALEGEVVENGPQRSEDLMTLLAARSHSGPLPAADEYAHYEMTLPGSAERILVLAERAMTLTEREAQHRHSVEDDVVSHNISHETRAQKIATAFGAVGLVAGIVFIAMGQVAGLIALLLPLGAFISRFLDSRNSK